MIHNKATLTPLYICQFCGKPFYHKSSYTGHVRVIHSEERPHRCSVCGMTFRDKGTHRYHERIHKEKPSIPCPICGKMFRKRWGVTQHMPIHTGLKPHVCVVCGKGFAQKHVLTSHMNTHDPSPVL